MSKRILIVEDEKNIVDILSFNLGREGYETLEAYDGEAGLQLALEQNPDDNPLIDHAGLQRFFRQLHYALPRFSYFVPVYHSIAYFVRQRHMELFQPSQSLQLSIPPAF